MDQVTAATGASQLPLEDQIALRLGRMSMRFAAVESIVRYVTLSLLDLSPNDKPKIDAVLAELPFRKLRATLLATARQVFGEGEKLEALHSMLRDIDRAEVRRNVLTHSAWNHSELPKQIAREKTRVSSGGAFRADQEIFVDIANLDAFVQHVHETGAAILQWYAYVYLGIVPPAAEQPVAAAERPNLGEH